MNIGIFTDTYSPQINGVVTSIKTLEQELRKLGHTVYIFAPRDPKARAADESPTVFHMPSMPLVFEKSKRLAFFYPPQILWNIRKLKLDLVHTQTEWSLGLLGKLVSKAARLPLVHTYHTMYEDYVHYVARGHLVTPAMAQKYSRFFCNRASVVIAPAKKTRDSLIEYGVIKPVELIPTGIDFAPFATPADSARETAEIKKSLKIPADAPVVVYVGRVAKEKSIDVILDSFPQVLRQIPSAYFVIVGDGPVRGELEKASKRLGISKKVIFTGYKLWSEIGKYYRLGDVFITASTSETQGLTYIEAMAAGVCVIAKRDKSTEDILEDGVTGFDFINDWDAAGVMIKALLNAETRQKLAAAALKRITPLSGESFAKKVEEVYKAAIENRKTLR